MGANLSQIVAHAGLRFGAIGACGMAMGGLATIMILPHARAISEHLPAPDPIGFAAAFVFVCGVAGFVSFTSAWRARRVDPARELIG